MKPPAILSPEALFAQRNEVVTVDCRFSLTDFSAGRVAYEKAHIPGAVHWDMEDDLAGAKTGLNGRHPLPDQDSFEQLLQRSGITADRRVVLYDDNRMAGAARAWWLLNFFGLRNVAILNGGFAAWRAVGFEVSDEPPAPMPSSITLTGSDESLRVLMADVEHTALLIDAREQERYLGISEPIDPVAGRIPGALNRTWTQTTNAQGQLTDIDSQRAAWQALLPADADTPVMYCGSGITASVNALSWQLADLGPVKIYAGSFSEWCANAANPIDKGPSE